MIRALLLAILLLLLARAFWRLVDGILEAASGRSRSPSGRAPKASVKLVRDPICGTHVMPGGISAISHGTTHYFCSEACREKFTRGT